MTGKEWKGIGRVLISLILLVLLINSVRADIGNFGGTPTTDNTLSIDLEWDDADSCGAGGNGDVDYYKITRDGNVIYTDISTSFLDIVGTAGTYEYEIFAYNESTICDQSSLNPITETTTDTTDPESVTYIDVMDYPNDDGTQILINWGHSGDYFEDDDNYLEYYRITKYSGASCTGYASNITLYRDQCTTPTYTWDDLTPGTNTSFQIFGIDASGNEDAGSACDSAIAEDNSGPAPPQNPEAEDILDDQGEDGIHVTWEQSPDQGSGSQDVTYYKLYGRYGPYGSYSYFGNESVGSGDQNKTYWEYSSEFNGAFDSRVVAEYLGLFVPPFDSNTFYFYVTAFDGTYETQSIHVTEAFNAEPEIKEMLMLPVKGTAQTADDISCVAFVCDVNDDDTITAGVDFSVTHFYGGSGGEEVSKNASCVKIGKIESGVIPQYPYMNVDCRNDLDEPGNIWECIAELENTYTYMGDKVSCEITPHDGKEYGESVSYVDEHDFYPVNNTAPTASEVEISPNNPYGNDTLTCEFEFNDIDGDEESIIGSSYALEYDKYTTYRWYINNEGINNYILLQGKNTSTLDEYYDQNDYVKCAVNPCDKDLSWLGNPLCQGEEVEGSQGKEHWILDGDVCAGYMECGLMNEGQCGYANESNWDCEWDADYVLATPATIYGSKAAGTFETGDLNYFNLSNDSQLKFLINGNVCAINIINKTNPLPHPEPSSYLVPSWEILGCIRNATNLPECGWVDANCTGIYADRITLDSYDEQIDAIKIYTTTSDEDQSLLVLDSDGNALDALGFEVGQQDYGSDAQGWCEGEINTQCRDLDAAGCSDGNVSLSTGGFCYPVSDILTFTNSTPKIIGGNSIPQIISYSDDSTNESPTNVGDEVSFEATWLDTDPNEQGKLIVCPLTGGTEDYGCTDATCPDSITFGDYGNTAWAYTNESSMLIETVEIKARQASINGTAYSAGESTPFIFSIIAFEADNNTMGDNPTSSLEGYYDDSTVIIARSDWNPLTVGEWSKFTLQYNAQPLEGKYTGLKLCVADPNEPGITGGGPTGYAVSGAEYQKVNTGSNWFTKMLWDIGNFLSGIFSFTGRATTSYNDNCMDIGELHPDYSNSTISVAANTSATPSLIYDDTSADGGPWYNKADIRINYQSSTGTGGSCPGQKTFCETELSPDREVSCVYEAEDEDETISEYHMRVCDDENSCSIWRSGYFFVNHLPYVDWTAIATNHLSYEDGLTYTSDANDDWNLQCIRSIAHDYDLDAEQTGQIIIDADGWTTPFQNQQEKDTNLIQGSTLKTCNSTGLMYIDVNGDLDYDYRIDTLQYNQSGTYKTILQFSNETSGARSIDFSSNCFYHDKDNDNVYDNAEDIIWDIYSNSATTTYKEYLNYTYEWFVKPYGFDEFQSCSDFLWCDNDGNDILTHGNTEPGDEWICSVKPLDSRGVGQARNSSIIHITSGTGGTPPSEGGPAITYVTDNSDEDTPIDFGQNVQINVGWEGPYDYVKLYICDGNSPYIRNSGCWGYEFNRTISSTSPIQSVFEVEQDVSAFEIGSHGPINYSVLLCNEEYDCSNYSSGNFYVNHVPEIEDIELLYYDGVGYVSGDSTNDSSTLNCSITEYDPEQDISAFSYSWWVHREGAWQLYWQEESVMNSLLLGYTSTEPGDEWKCSAVPRDAYSTGVEEESNIISITSGTGSESNMSILNIIDDASRNYPKNVDQNVTFNVYWQNANAEYVVAYICDGPNVAKTGCTAGSKQLGFSGWTSSNPITLTYEVEEDDYGTENNMTVNYYARMCDNNFDCSEVFHSSNSTMGTNHLPEAEGVSLLNSTNGTFINESSDILCNYSFSDMDNSLYNGLGYNTSLYRVQSDVDFTWYRYISGNWVQQAYTTQILPDSATSNGQRWKCGIQFNDGYADGPVIYSPMRVVGDDSPVIDSVETNANEDDPLPRGEELVFTVDWYDPQQESGELINLYICDNFSVSADGCEGTTFCQREGTPLDPINCTMDSAELENFTTIYTVTIFDLDGNMAQTYGNVYVNSEPMMNYTNITPLYPISSENLFCDAAGYDDDSASAAYYYNWYKDTGSGFMLFSYPNNETLLDEYTSTGQRWKCGAKICDAYSCSDEMNSTYVTVTQYGSNETPQILDINVDSTYTEPTNVGDPVIFTINWTDADLTFGEYVQVFICNSTSIIENAGCIDKGFVSSGFLSSNLISVSYIVEEEDNNATDAYVMLCDDSEICSDIESTQFYVNHVPYAENVQVINSTNGTYFTNETYLFCNYTFMDLDATPDYSSNYNSSQGAFFFWYKYANGNWVNQNKNIQILPDSYTDLGEAWKCGVLASDGYATGSQIMSEAIAIGNINPVIENVTVNGMYEDPLKYGNSATFSIDWFDASPGESVDIFVCSSSGHNRYGCTEKTFCSLDSVNSSPYECNYDTDGLSQNIVNQQYYVYIYDPTNLNGSYSSAEHSNNLYINHPPTIQYANLTAEDLDIYPDDEDNLVCLGYDLDDADNTSALPEYGNETSLIYTWYLDQGAGFVVYPYSGRVLTEWHTLPGDYWMCKAKPYDGYDYGTEMTSPIRYIYNDEVTEIPFISYVSLTASTDEPANVGETIEFTITWVDSDQPFGETVDVYICDGQGRYSDGGCMNPYVESFNIGSSPLVIEYTTSDSAASSSNFSIQLEDSDNQKSNWYNGTFGVNHRPNVTDLRTIQIDESTLKCDFTYLESNFGGLRDDSQIEDNYSDDYSWYKWYQYLGGAWTEILSGIDAHSQYYEKEFSGGELIKCSVMVGDEWGLTDTQYRTATSVEVQSAPEVPILWEMPESTGQSRIEVIGYIDESDLRNLSAEAYSWQGYEEPKINQSVSLNSAYLKGTSSVIDSFSQNNPYVVISGTNHQQFSTGSWVEFANHNRTYFARYYVSNKITIIPGSQYRLNLAPSLENDVPYGTIINSYNSSYPNGWFRFNLSLQSGENLIKARAKRNIGTGNISSDFSEGQEVMYDNILPNIDAADILGYATSNQPLLQFEVSDNYELNMTTLMLNVTDSNGDSTYYLTDDTSYSYTPEGSHIVCEHVSSENYLCNVLIYVADGEYSLNFSVFDTAGNSNFTYFPMYLVNSTNPVRPTIKRSRAEYNITNLTYNISIPVQLQEGVDKAMIQFAIGTNYYPSSGWNSVMDWTNVTDFDETNQYIDSSDITALYTHLNMSTGNLNLTPHTIYIANVRYRLQSWTKWSTVGFTQAMKYFPPYEQAESPTSVNVTAPPFSFSPYITVSWTPAQDTGYGVSHYIIAAGTSEYPYSGWNNTLEWTYAGTGLSKTLDLNSLLDHLQDYYFTVSAVNYIGDMGVPSSSYGTTYYDQTPPIIEIISVAGDTEEYDGWLDSSNDESSLVQISGDELMTCYHSPYDKDYQDYNSATDSYCGNSNTNPSINMNCNIPTSGQGDFSYYIICQDTMNPQPNKQNRTQNTNLAITLDWPDNPEVEPAITILNNTIAPNSVYGREYALDDDLLECSYVYSDQDGNSTVIDSLTEIRWLVNGAVSSQTDQYTTVSSMAERGDNITCQVRVFDITQRTSGWQNSPNVFVNNSVPSSILILNPTQNSYYKDSIYFNWTESSDADEDEITYWMHVFDPDGDDIVNVSNTRTYWNKDISDREIWVDGEYIFNIELCDDSGFENSCVLSENRSFGVDYTSPSVEIVSPSDGDIWGIYFDIYADISDSGSGLNTYWYNVTNSSGESVREGILVFQGGQYYARVLTSGLSTGDYTVTAYAEDNVGNQNSSSVDIQLDLSAPNMEIDTENWIFREQWLKDTLDMRIALNDTGTIFDAHNYTVVSYVMKYQDGTPKKSNSTSSDRSYYTWNQTFNTTGWVEGRYDITFRIIDYWNNTNIIPTWFVVDRTSPDYQNEESEPYPVYDKDDINLSVDWINNVFVWNANENNIDKDLTLIQYTKNISDISSYENMTLANDEMDYLGDTFYGTIDESYTDAEDIVYWRSIAYDLAGNSRIMPWQEIDVASTPPSFDENIADISWPEDTDYDSLDLDDYFSDADGDVLSYSMDIFPQGTLIYDDYNNEEETQALKEGVYENVEFENGLNSNSLLIQAEVNNLLVNGDFEDNSYDEEYVQIPYGWIRHSYPTYSHNGPPAESYVIADEHNYYTQAVEVENDATYTLSMYVINNTSPGYGRMHINWFNSIYLSDDTVNKTLSYIGSTLDCEQPYNCTGIYLLGTTDELNSSEARRSLIIDSPSDAAYAEIVLDTDNTDVQARIDKVQFEQKDYASVFYAGQRLPGAMHYPADSGKGRANIELADGTIAMFVKPTWDAEYTEYEQETFFNINSGGVDVFTIKAEDEELIFSLMNDAYSIEQDISGWEEGEWHLIAATWGPAGITLTIDDSRESETASVSFGSINIEDSRMYIGSDSEGDNQANAYIDEFIIFDYIKSASEISEIYNSQNSSYIAEPISASIPISTAELTPEADYFGQQRAVFYAEDSYTRVGSNMVNLLVTAVNDAPRFNQSNTLPDQGWWVNQNKSIDLSDILYDVDGSGVLTYTLNLTGGNGNISLEYSGTTVTLISDEDWTGIQEGFITGRDSNSQNYTNLFNMTVYFNLLNETYVEGIYYLNNHSNLLTEIYQTEVYISNITEIAGTLISDSYIYNSNISNSNITSSNVINSTLIDINLEDAFIVGAYIDPSNITNSTIIGDVVIIDSHIMNSEIRNSSIYDSNIYNWVVHNANITDNEICWGIVYNWDQSEIIFNKTYNGICNYLPDLVNYDPIILSFSVSIDDDNDIGLVQFLTNDIDFESAEGETLSYTIDWGQGSDTTGTLTSELTVAKTHLYTESGTYNILFTIQDDEDGEDSSNGIIIVDVEDEDDDSPGGGSGGSSGGGSSGNSNEDEEDEEEQSDYVGQATSSTPKATCSDGIKNQGEEGVDCGGPCPPCLVKATCSDGIKNQGEEGVDCGGPCTSCSKEESEESALTLLPYFIALLVASVIIFLIAMYRPKKKPIKETGLRSIVEDQHPLPHHISAQPGTQQYSRQVEKQLDAFEALRQYINARLRQGTDKGHIKETLMMKGWPEEVVDVALDGSTELESKLNEVEDYIRNSFASGYKLIQIKSALMERGWSEGITDLLLFEVHRPSRNLRNLREYVDYKIMQGKNLSEIKQILRSVGWREEVIDSIMK